MSLISPSRDCVPHSPRAPVPFPPSRPLEHPSQEPTTTHSPPSPPGHDIGPSDKTNPRRILTSSAVGRHDRSKRTQKRAAGDPGGWQPQSAGTGGKPGGNRRTDGYRLWDHKLVKATCTAGLVISGAWSSTPGVVGANGDRRRGSSAHLWSLDPPANKRPARFSRSPQMLCVFSLCPGSRVQATLCNECIVLDFCPSGFQRLSPNSQ